MQEDIKEEDEEEEDEDEKKDDVFEPDKKLIGQKVESSTPPGKQNEMFTWKLTNMKVAEKNDVHFQKSRVRPGTAS